MLLRTASDLKRRMSCNTSADGVFGRHTALPATTGGFGVAVFHNFLELSDKLECPAGVFGLGTASQQSLGVFVVLLAVLAVPMLRQRRTCSFALDQGPDLFWGWCSPWEVSNRRLRCHLHQTNGTSSRWKCADRRITRPAVRQRLDDAHFISLPDGSCQLRRGRFFRSVFFCRVSTAIPERSKRAGDLIGRADNHVRHWRKSTASANGGGSP